MNTINLLDLFTPQQIAKAYELKTAKFICEQITKPNIEEINRKTGQENDPMYLAYALEYAVSQGE